jgi:MOSC domain-containing protein
MIEHSAILKSLYRYPVKGLSAQALQCATLSAGETVPGDRRYAIENGPSGFDPAAPKYYPKQRFLMLMRNERLAALRVDYDQTGHIIMIKTDGQVICSNLCTSEGRTRIESFFYALLPRRTRAVQIALCRGSQFFRCGQ